MERSDLTIAQVADIAGCHRNTVLNYEKRGIIRAMRDINGFRKFPAEEADRLKELLTMRRDPGADNEK